MAIHHATVKRAAKLGVTLTEVNDGTAVQATWDEQDKSIIGSKPADAINAMVIVMTLHYEYPALTLTNADDGSFDIAHNDEVIVPDVDVSDKSGTINDALDRCHELDIDPEEGFDEHDLEDASSVVVRSKYKEQYAAGGHPDDCGDVLAAYCRGMEFETFVDMCAENEVVPSSKIAASMETKTRGWKGRARMSLGNALRKVIRANGNVLTHGGKPIDLITWDARRQEAE